MNNSYNLTALLDFTSLNDVDNEEAISTLCERAQGLKDGPVAAVCVFPQFVSLAKKLLISSTINVATVSNFPGGDQLNYLEEIETAIANGANEIDWVLPYQTFLSGKDISGDLKAVREASKNTLLKVIIESGAYPNTSLIQTVTQYVIDAGADFVKTSTGKIAQGASPQAAQAILLTIKNSGTNTGIKLSGGIRKRAQAIEYLNIICEQMGEEWIDSKHVRFGCSKVPD
ncbi:MAG: deoxyribose-phosphate aldolase [Gammaproteobacteria bacterium RIFCSPHIGHO2_12_FULL_41_15]|nr:MAG: deoxyribose-phosphate aldolase [Gammaproteobacteria bacterium RIFCSPHIGHO2_12_FULL_41_15]